MFTTIFRKIEDHSNCAAGRWGRSRKFGGVGRDPGVHAGGVMAVRSKKIGSANPKPARRARAQKPWSARRGRAQTRWRIMPG